ncbi:hypothetical protein HDV00_000551 [Rhizophlyctis rosea]|nr:hypothetical protein HDV00_000551 [Rhizophlyctis rosea]
MTSQAQLANLFKSLSISSVAHSHKQAGSLQQWVEILKADHPAAVTDYAAVKTLVLKPKGGKVTNPIVVVALETSQVPINPLVKSLGNKEARVAADDVWKSTLKVDRIDATPFALANVEDKSTVTAVVDQEVLASADRHLAFRNYASDNSLFVKAADFKAFLDKINVTFAEVKLSDLATPAPAAKSEVAKPAPKAKAEVTAADAGDDKKLIGITVKKDDDFPTWYQQVLTRAEMLDYYDISGCYILRPWAFNIWKAIQKFFGGEIEKLGVEDCYFPMFVSSRALEREKDHIEGFSPEVAWVTKAISPSGKSDLAEPIAVRPTSETVMYPYYAQWIRSHRDLPLRLNQWCNVVRWEFKHPQPFIRTREFLWQEGHTAFATLPEAEKEVRDILDLYRRVYEEYLAVPVVPGKKSEKEKFAGGYYTTTVEGFIPTTGRAIQGATSHCLGQNFSKMFNIVIDNDAKERSHVWQNSWGLSTRTLGVVVMVHGDDQGLVLPPKVASIQVIVIPTGITAKSSEEERKNLWKKSEELAETLTAAGIRAKADLRDNYTPPYKYNHWELRGVPIRLELGPKDLAKNEACAFRRDTRVKAQHSLATIAQSVQSLLDTIQSDMFNKAKKERDERLVKLEKWEGFVEALNKKCIVLAPWCEREQCEEDVKDNSARGSAGDEPQDEKAPSMGAKTLCIPFDQPESGEQVAKRTCFACDHKAKSWTLWGRSY